MNTIGTAHRTKSTVFEEALNEVKKGTLTAKGAALGGGTTPGATLTCNFVDIFETPLTNGEERTVTVPISASSASTCELRYREANTITWTGYPMTAATAKVTVKIDAVPTAPGPGEGWVYADIGSAKVELTGIETARLNASCAQIKSGPISLNSAP
jgi:hypothetical protein